MNSTTVIKRNGIKTAFELDKIVRVVHRITTQDLEETSINLITDQLIDNLKGNKEVTTNQINDALEEVLMDFGMYAEARELIQFRLKKLQVQLVSQDSAAMPDYMFMSRYAVHLPRRRRRETWDEAVDRVKDMHIRKYPMAAKDIAWAFEQVRDKRVLPSMRSMQFGGKPIEEKNSRMYNCTYSIVDRPEFFRETMFLLLTGCGVGFSVEMHNLEKFPTLKLPNKNDIVHHTIADTIEGWADAVDMLIDSYVNGYTVEFIYKKIRPEGAKIRSGGKAPGHVPLRRSLEKCRAILDQVVKRDEPRLKTIEAYDLVMHIADAVLSGGVRRSATICLFSPEDDDMINAKTGNWFEENPQRGRSNNSVKLIRDETSPEQFQRIFNKQKEFGEPGFYFVDNKDYGCNPCVEIGLNPYLPKEDGTKESGFQMCNLTTINGAKLKTFEDFKIAVRAATIIGTCQAGFTVFPYLGETSEEICRRESLLGVSITGMMDAPDVALVPENLREMAKYAVEVNKHTADVIGIPQAARVTCVKPEGSSSLLLDTASGIHPRFGKRYFRRIQANRNDPVYQHFKKNNPHACEKSVWSTNDTDDVITFCVKAPDDAIVRDDMTALEFLHIVKMVQENWVLPGTARPDSSPGVYHNVSNTVTVKPHEWDEVQAFIYKHKEFFTGVSLLPDNGSKVYQQAPHEIIREGDDEMAWSNLVEGFQIVDYTSLNEDDDNTKLKEVIACAGGACEL